MLTPALHTRTIYIYIERERPQRSTHTMHISTIPHTIYIYTTPQSRMYRMTPALQMSQLLPYPAPDSTSGATKFGDPHLYTTKCK